MCQIKIPQEESSIVLAVGHKVRYEGKECVITSIRVWHDLATLLDPPHRVVPIFDVYGEGWSAINLRIDELQMWRPKPQIPAAPPPSSKVRTGSD